MRYGGMDGGPGAEFDMRRRRTPLELAAQEAALRMEQNAGGGMPLDHAGGQVALPPRAPAPVAMAPQAATPPQAAPPPVAPPLGGLAQPHLQPTSLAQISVARRRRPQLGAPAPMYRPRKPKPIYGVQAPAY